VQDVAAELIIHFLYGKWHIFCFSPRRNCLRYLIAERLQSGDIAMIETLGRSRSALQPAGDPHRILIVDDYVDAAESMATLLKFEGHEISTAKNGEIAIQLADRFKPDVVFLDIGLQGMSGFEVARVLRQKPETRDCVLIALSGYGQPDDHVLSREAGFDRHLLKPVDLANLQEILGSLGKRPAASAAA
jgi:two-component system, OmpR family, response regulator